MLKISLDILFENRPSDFPFHSPMESKQLAQKRQIPADLNHFYTAFPFPFSKSTFILCVASDVNNKTKTNLQIFTHE